MSRYWADIEASQSPYGFSPDLDLEAFAAERVNNPRSQSPYGFSPDLDWHYILTNKHPIGDCHNRLTASVLIWTYKDSRMLDTEFVKSQSPYGFSPDLDYQ